jgi:hypothetical protein
MKARTISLLALVLVIVAAGAFFALRHKAPPAPPPATHAAVAPTPTPPPPAPATVPADCLLPGPPPVPPDGQTATEADMRLGHNVIQAFVKQLEAYQACRNAQVDHATASAEQKQQWLDEGNAAVDKANELAQAFAVQLKIYKARPPKR